MEEKKWVNSNYGILVIILFSIVCVLADYIIIDRNLKEVSIDNTVIEDNCIGINSKIVKSYKNISGMYVYNDMDTVRLYLYTDGTFYYQTSVRYAHGVIGNYIIDGDSVILNTSFKHGSDIAVRMDFSTIKLSINSDGNIVDNDPLYFYNDDEYGNIGSVLLEKKNSFIDEDNSNSYYKEVLSRGVLFNGNTVESFE